MNNRGWCGALLCALACAGSFSATLQASPNAEFPVTEKQALALGIQLMPLAASTHSGKAIYPAKVVLPASSEFVVSAPADGLIIQVLVESGQAVKQGQPLLRLSSPELAKMQLELLHAANKSRLAQQTAAREDRLFKEGIISERRQQEAASARLDATATLHQARAALLVSGMSPAVIDRVIRTGKLEDSLTLGARATGIVTDMTAHPGQRVEPATSLLTITALGNLWLDIQLPPAQASGVALKSSVAVVGRGVMARTISISPLVGSSQTVTLRARVESGASLLRAGEFVQVALPLTQATGAWDLPLRAVARQGEQAYVFVRTAKGFSARPVKIIASAGQQVRLQGGLKAGEQIAVSSVVTLKAAWLGESGGE